MVHIKKKKNLRIVGTILIPIIQMWKLSTERLRDFPKVSDLVGAGAMIQTQTVLPLVFTTTLQATPFASYTPDICCFLVFQSLKESCQPVSLDVLSLPTEFLTVGTFSSFPSESKCHGFRRSSLYLLKS